MSKRYLTKSRFKLAMECPTKLFYTGKRNYANQKLDNPFLETLAEGGFQVGELAKAYYPGGYDIESLDYETALRQTNELLQQENCIIYEAAIKYANLFVRVDILVKQGNHIKLIEVKSKSADTKIKKLSLGEDDKLNADWRSYVYDITFQYYVAEQAFPNYTVTPYLMLVDKDAVCPTDGLHQKIKVEKDESGRTQATIVEELTEEDLSEKLLRKFNTKIICRKLIDDHTYDFQAGQLSFAELVNVYAEHYVKDRKIDPVIKSECKNCEFKATNDKREQGLLCGYRQCFTEVLSWNEEDFTEDTIFDLWNLHWRTTNSLLSENKIRFSQISEGDILVKTNHKKPGISPAERRWLQIEKSLKKDASYYIDRVNLKKEMEDWIYPYHFIDFETLRPVIPFKQGSKPNEIIAFQFSHHIVTEDGNIEHKSQYLETTPGVHPNYQFVRELKRAIGQDNGTVFIYSSHEKTVLNEIYRQLKADSAQIEDRGDLCHFIEELMQERPAKGEGKNRKFIVDLLELVKQFYYDPYTKGSNSIKAVLPAILNSSDYIKKKYDKPIYGTDVGIKSLNFKDHTWVQVKGEEVIDPYEHLTNLFDHLLEKYDEYSNLFRDINDGGAAMSAYERLQYENIPSAVRNIVEDALLKYCELDTFAMVLIYEAWVDMINN